MSHLEDYKILEADSPAAMERKIKDLLRYDWELSGNLIVAYRVREGRAGRSQTDIFYLQVMVILKGKS